MGHKLWFLPATGCDAISATANGAGFTPLTAAARHFGWDPVSLGQATDACNARRQVAVVNDIAPTLFLVPQTKGVADAQFLIKDLLRAVSKVGVNGLHFTHYGFLQGRFPTREIADVLHELLDPGTGSRLTRLVFDIDHRMASSLYSLMQPRP